MERAFQDMEGRIIEQARVTDADNNETLLALEPTCTHMGYHVTWNNMEKSWDCPCHGAWNKKTGHAAGPCLTLRTYANVTYANVTYENLAESKMVVFYIA
jgi:Rieske Fe-S protein